MHPKVEEAERMRLRSSPRVGMTGSTDICSVV